MVNVGVGGYVAACVACKSLNAEVIPDDLLILPSELLPLLLVQLMKRLYSLREQAHRFFLFYEIQVFIDFPLHNIFDLPWNQVRPLRYNFRALRQLR